MPAYTYAFLSVSAALVGPGGNISLAAGAQAAEEGITIAMRAEKDTLTIGADGAGMHSQRADNSATVRVRLLKTSPQNRLLMEMYNAQRNDPSLWGGNTITVNDVNRGDAITLRGVAFQKAPDITYATEGGMNEWEFNAVQCDMKLGAGVPVLA